MIVTTSTTSSPFLIHRKANFRNEISGFISTKTSSFSQQHPKNAADLSSDCQNGKMSTLTQVEKHVRSPTKRLALEILPSKMQPFENETSKPPMLSADMGANPLISSSRKNSDACSTISDAKFPAMNFTDSSTEGDFNEPPMFSAVKVDSASVTSENLKSGDLLEDSFVSESSSIVKLNLSNDIIMKMGAQNSDKNHSFCIEESSKMDLESVTSKSMTSLAPRDVTSPMCSEHSTSSMALSKNSDDSLNETMAAAATRIEKAEVINNTMKSNVTSGVLTLQTSLHQSFDSKLAKRDSAEVLFGTTSVKDQTVNLALNQLETEILNVARENEVSKFSGEVTRSSFEDGNYKHSKRKSPTGDVSEGSLLSTSSNLQLVKGFSSESTDFLSLAQRGLSDESYSNLEGTNNLEPVTAEESPLNESGETAVEMVERGKIHEMEDAKKSGSSSTNISTQHRAQEFGNDGDSVATNKINDEKVTDPKAEKSDLTRESLRLPLTEKNEGCQNLAEIHTESPVTNDLCHMHVGYSETPPTSASEPESYKWAFPFEGKKDEILKLQNEVVSGGCKYYPVYDKSSTHFSCHDHEAEMVHMAESLVSEANCDSESTECPIVPQKQAQKGLIRRSTLDLDSSKIAALPSNKQDLDDATLVQANDYTPQLLENNEAREESDYHKEETVDMERQLVNSEDVETSSVANNPQPRKTRLPPADQLQTSEKRSPDFEDELLDKTTSNQMKQSVEVPANVSAGEELAVFPANEQPGACDKTPDQLIPVDLLNAQVRENIDANNGLRGEPILHQTDLSDAAVESPDTEIELHEKTLPLELDLSDTPIEEHPNANGVQLKHILQRVGQIDDPLHEKTDVDDQTPNLNNSLEMASCNAQVKEKLDIDILLPPDEVIPLQLSLLGEKRDAVEDEWPDAQNLHQVYQSDATVEQKPHDYIELEDQTAREGNQLDATAPEEQCADSEMHERPIPPPQLDLLNAPVNENPEQSNLSLEDLFMNASVGEQPHTGELWKKQSSSQPDILNGPLEEKRGSENQMNDPPETAIVDAPVEENAYADDEVFKKLSSQKDLSHHSDAGDELSSKTTSFDAELFNSPVEKQGISGNEGPEEPVIIVYDAPVREQADHDDELRESQISQIDFPDDREEKPIAANGFYHEPSPLQSHILDVPVRDKPDADDELNNRTLPQTYNFDSVVKAETDADRQLSEETACIDENPSDSSVKHRSEADEQVTKETSPIDFVDSPIEAIEVEDELFEKPAYVDGNALCFPVEEQSDANDQLKEQSFPPIDDFDHPLQTQGAEDEFSEKPAHLKNPSDSSLKHRSEVDVQLTKKTSPKDPVDSPIEEPDVEDELSEKLAHLNENALGFPVKKQSDAGDRLNEQTSSSMDDFDHPLEKQGTEDELSEKPPHLDENPLNSSVKNRSEADVELSKETSPIDLVDSPKEEPDVEDELYEKPAQFNKKFSDNRMEIVADELLEEQTSPMNVFDRPLEKSGTDDELSEKPGHLNELPADSSVTDWSEADVPLTKETSSKDPVDSPIEEPDVEDELCEKLAHLNENALGFPVRKQSDADDQVYEQTSPSMDDFDHPLEKQGAVDELNEKPALLDENPLNSSVKDWSEADIELSKDPVDSPIEEPDVEDKLSEKLAHLKENALGFPMEKQSDAEDQLKEQTSASMGVFDRPSEETGVKDELSEKPGHLNELYEKPALLDENLLNSSVKDRSEADVELSKETSPIDLLDSPKEEPDVEDELSEKPAQFNKKFSDNRMEIVADVLLEEQTSSMNVFDRPLEKSGTDDELSEKPGHLNKLPVDSLVEDRSGVDVPLTKETSPKDPVDSPIEAPDAEDELSEKPAQFNKKFSDNRVEIVADELLEEQTSPMNVFDRPLEKSGTDDELCEKLAHLNEKALGFPVRKQSDADDQVNEQTSPSMDDFDHPLEKQGAVDELNEKPALLDENPLNSSVKDWSEADIELSKDPVDSPIEEPDVEDKLSEKLAHLKENALGFPMEKQSDAEDQLKEQTSASMGVFDRPSEETGVKDELSEKPGHLNELYEKPALLDENPLNSSVKDRSEADVELSKETSPIDLVDSPKEEPDVEDELSEKPAQFNKKFPDNRMEIVADELLEEQTSSMNVFDRPLEKSGTDDELSEKPGHLNKLPADSFVKDWSEADVPLSKETSPKDPVDSPIEQPGVEDKLSEKPAQFNKKFSDNRMEIVADELLEEQTSPMNVFDRPLEKSGTDDELSEKPGHLNELPADSSVTDWSEADVPLTKETSSKDPVDSPIEEPDVEDKLSEKLAHLKENALGFPVKKQSDADDRLNEQASPSIDDFDNPLEKQGAKNELYEKPAHLDKNPLNSSVKDRSEADVELSKETSPIDLVDSPKEEPDVEDELYEKPAQFNKKFSDNRMEIVADEMLEEQTSSMNVFDRPLEKSGTDDDLSETPGHLNKLPADNSVKDWSEADVPLSKETSPKDPVDSPIEEPGVEDKLCEKLAHLNENALGFLVKKQSDADDQLNEQASPSIDDFDNPLEKQGAKNELYEKPAHLDENPLNSSVKNRSEADVELSKETSPIDFVDSPKEEPDVEDELYEKPAQFNKKFSDNRMEIVADELLEEQTSPMNVFDRPLEKSGTDDELSEKPGHLNELPADSSVTDWSEADVPLTKETSSKDPVDSPIEEPDVEDKLSEKLAHLKENALGFPVKKQSDADDRLNEQASPSIDDFDNPLEKQGAKNELYEKPAHLDKNPLNSSVKDRSEADVELSKETSPIDLVDSPKEEPDVEDELYEKPAQFNKKFSDNRMEIVADEMLEEQTSSMNVFDRPLEKSGTDDDLSETPGHLNKLPADNSVKDWSEADVPLSKETSPKDPVDSPIEEPGVEDKLCEKLAHLNENALGFLVKKQSDADDQLNEQASPSIDDFDNPLEKQGAKNELYEKPAHLDENPLNSSVKNRSEADVELSKETSPIDFVDSPKEEPDVEDELYEKPAQFNKKFSDNRMEIVADELLEEQTSPMNVFDRPLEKSGTDDELSEKPGHLNELPADSSVTDWSEADVPLTKETSSKDPVDSPIEVPDVEDELCEKLAHLNENAFGFPVRKQSDADDQVYEQTSPSMDDFDHPLEKQGAVDELNEKPALLDENPLNSSVKDWSEADIELSKDPVDSPIEEPDVEDKLSEKLAHLNENALGFLVKKQSDADDQLNEQASPSIDDFDNPLEKQGAKNELYEKPAHLDKNPLNSSVKDRSEADVELSKETSPIDLVDSPKEEPDVEDELYEKPAQFNKKFSDNRMEIVADELLEEQTSSMNVFDRPLEKSGTDDDLSEKPGHLNKLPADSSVKDWSEADVPLSKETSPKDPVDSPIEEPGVEDKLCEKLAHPNENALGFLVKKQSDADDQLNEQASPSIDDFDNPLEKQGAKNELYEKPAHLDENPLNSSVKDRSEADVELSKETSPIDLVDSPKEEPDVEDELYEKPAQFNKKFSDNRMEIVADELLEEQTSPMNVFDRPLEKSGTDDELSEKPGHLNELPADSSVTDWSEADVPLTKETSSKDPVDSPIEEPDVEDELCEKLAHLNENALGFPVRKQSDADDQVYEQTSPSMDDFDHPLEKQGAVDELNEKPALLDENPLNSSVKDWSEADIELSKDPVDSPIEEPDVEDKLSEKLAHLKENALGFPVKKQSDADDRLNEQTSPSVDDFDHPLEKQGTEDELSEKPAHLDENPLNSSVKDWSEADIELSKDPVDSPIEEPDVEDKLSEKLAHLKENALGFPVKKQSDADDRLNEQTSPSMDDFDHPLEKQGTEDELSEKPAHLDEHPLNSSVKDRSEADVELLKETSPIDLVDSPNEEPDLEDELYEKPAQFNKKFSDNRMEIVADELLEEQTSPMNVFDRPLEKSGTDDEFSEKRTHLCVDPSDSQMKKRSDYGDQLKEQTSASEDVFDRPIEVIGDSDTPVKKRTNVHDELLKESPVEVEPGPEDHLSDNSEPLSSSDPYIENPEKPNAKFFGCVVASTEKVIEFLEADNATKKAPGALDSVLENVQTNYSQTSKDAFVKDVSDDESNVAFTYEKEQTGGNPEENNIAKKTQNETRKISEVLLAVKIAEFESPGVVDASDQQPSQSSFPCNEMAGDNATLVAEKQCRTRVSMNEGKKACDDSKLDRHVLPQLDALQENTTNDSSTVAVEKPNFDNDETKLPSLSLEYALDFSAGVKAELDVEETVILNTLDNLVEETVDYDVAPVRSFSPYTLGYLENETTDSVKGSVSTESQGSKAVPNDPMKIISKTDDVDFDPTSIQGDCLNTPVEKLIIPDDDGPYAPPSFVCEDTPHASVKESPRIKENGSDQAVSNPEISMVNLGEEAHEKPEKSVHTQGNDSYNSAEQKRTGNNCNEADESTCVQMDALNSSAKSKPDEELETTSSGTDATDHGSSIICYQDMKDFGHFINEVLDPAFTPIHSSSLNQESGNDSSLAQKPHSNQIEVTSIAVLNSSVTGLNSAQSTSPTSLTLDIDSLLPPTEIVPDAQIVSLVHDMDAVLIASKVTNPSCPNSSDVLSEASAQSSRKGSTQWQPLSTNAFDIPETFLTSIGKDGQTVEQSEQRSSVCVHDEIKVSDTCFGHELDPTAIIGSISSQPFFDETEKGIIVKEDECKFKLCGSNVGLPDVCYSIGSVIVKPNHRFEKSQVLENSPFASMSAQTVECNYYFTDRNFMNASTVRNLDCYNQLSGQNHDSIHYSHPYSVQNVAHFKHGRELRGQASFEDPPEDANNGKFEQCEESPVASEQVSVPQLITAIDPTNATHQNAMSDAIPHLNDDLVKNANHEASWPLLLNEQNIGDVNLVKNSAGDNIISERGDSINTNNTTTNQSERSTNICPFQTEIVEASSRESGGIERNFGANVTSFNTTYGCKPTPTLPPARVNNLRKSGEISTKPTATKEDLSTKSVPSEMSSGLALNPTMLGSFSSGFGPDTSDDLGRLGDVRSNDVGIFDNKVTRDKNEGIVRIPRKKASTLRAGDLANRGSAKSQNGSNSFNLKVSSRSGNASSTRKDVKDADSSSRTGAKNFNSIDAKVRGLLMM